MNSQAYIWKLSANNNECILKKIENTVPWSSLDEITRALPDGAYTSLRTYNHTGVVHFNDHLERLKETCRLSGYSLIIDPELIRSGMREILKSFNDLTELRLRIAVDLSKNRGEIFLAAEPLVTPTLSDYQSGVRVATTILTRANPKAKLSQFLTSANQIRNKFSRDLNEIIMVGHDGQLLEGLSSNFFAIKDGKIWTEDKDVLSGITRSIIFEVASDLGVPVIKKGILLEELRFVKEIFISSASRSVLPVKEIDSYWSGVKVPGAITSKIMKAFDEKILKILEPM
jgi:branched-chain amino acid aminotransferase